MLAVEVGEEHVVGLLNETIRQLVSDHKLLLDQKVSWVSLVLVLNSVDHLTQGLVYDFVDAGQNVLLADEVDEGNMADQHHYHAQVTNDKDRLDA